MAGAGELLDGAAAPVDALVADGDLLEVGEVRQAREGGVAHGVDGVAEAEGAELEPGAAARRVVVAQPVKVALVVHVPAVDLVEPHAREGEVERLEVGRAEQDLDDVLAPLEQVAGELVQRQGLEVLEAGQIVVPSPRDGHRLREVERRETVRVDVVDVNPPDPWAGLAQHLQGGRPQIVRVGPSVCLKNTRGQSQYLRLLMGGNQESDSRKGFQERHLADQFLGHLVEGIMVVISRLDTRPGDQAPRVVDVPPARRLEPLDGGVQLAIEIDDEFRVKELANQAEVAEVLWAADLRERPGW